MTDRELFGDERFFAMKAKLISKEEEELLLRLRYDDWTFSTRENYQESVENLSYAEFKVLLKMLAEWEETKLADLNRLLSEVEILKEVLKDELDKSCKCD